MKDLKIQESLDEISDSINKINSTLRESIRLLHKRYEEEAPRIDLLIQAMDDWAARAINLASDKSPMGRRMDYRVTLWAQHGWFPSIHETPLSLISQTAEGLEFDNEGRLESIIAKYFESEASKFIENIVLHEPARAHIIRDAFQAHNDQRYSLSIPVFLIQADGIASQIFGIDSIYTITEPNFKIIREYFQKQEEKRIGFGSIQFLIGSLSPLNASRKKRAIYAKGLNRHQVIHGESVTYDTEINSLKALSWIHFVSETLRYAK